MASSQTFLLYTKYSLDMKAQATLTAKDLEMLRTEYLGLSKILIPANDVKFTVLLAEGMFITYCALIPVRECTKGYRQVYKCNTNRFVNSYKPVKHQNVWPLRLHKKSCTAPPHEVTIYTRQ